MTTIRTLTIATTAGLALLAMHGCGGMSEVKQQVVGAGGGAGIGGATGSCPSCGSLEQCWSNQFCVAKLVPITGGFSIDATEVTAAQYSAWRATNPSTALMPSCCTNWKTNYHAGTGTENYPVATVDWCDAYAYCKGVGKRLCGKIGGGSADYDTGWNNAAQDQWHSACTSGGVVTYPYGSTYQPQTCNGLDHGAGATVAVGSMTACESSVSGFTGVYDLSVGFAQRQRPEG